MYLKPGFFIKTVTTAGTAERLTDSKLRPVWVRIQPEDDNTVPMYIGDSQVSATNGLELNIDLNDTTDIQSAKYIEFGSTMPGAIPISLRDIWVDTGNAGEGVEVFYLERAENEDSL